MLSLGVVLGAVLIGAAIVGFLSARRRLVINDRGIRDPNLGLGWILWEEIEGLYPPTARGTETLHLRVRVSERLSRILRRRRRAGSSAEPLSGALDVRLDLAGSDVSAVEVLQRMLARLPDERITPSRGKTAPLIRKLESQVQ